MFSGSFLPIIVPLFQFNIRTRLEWYIENYGRMNERTLRETETEKGH